MVQLPDTAAHYVTSLVWAQWLEQAVHWEHEEDGLTLPLIHPASPQGLLPTQHFPLSGASYDQAPMY